MHDNSGNKIDAHKHREERRGLPSRRFGTLALEIGAQIITWEFLAGRWPVQSGGMSLLWADMKVMHAIRRESYYSYFPRKNLSEAFSHAGEPKKLD